MKVASISPVRVCCTCVVVAAILMTRWLTTSCHVYGTSFPLVHILWYKSHHLHIEKIIYRNIGTSWALVVFHWIMRHNTIDVRYAHNTSLDITRGFRVMLEFKQSTIAQTNYRTFTITKITDQSGFTYYINISTFLTSLYRKKITVQYNLFVPSSMTCVCR